jgi:hypothetical protein
VRKSLYFALIGLFLAIVARSTCADTVKEVAQEIRAGSVLPLHQNVAGFRAANLLAAQDPSVCDYCAMDADSLPLSIAAVLRAITIEADAVYGYGLTYCDRSNCWLASLQSTIAYR